MTESLVYEVGEEDIPAILRSAGDDEDPALVLSEDGRAVALEVKGASVPPEGACVRLSYAPEDPLAPLAGLWRVVSVVYGAYDFTHGARYYSDATYSRVVVLLRPWKP